MFSIFKKTKPSGKTINLKINGMHCTSCSLNIDGSLEDMNGVIDSNTSYAKSTTKVTFDPSKISQEKIIDVIKQAGYTIATDN